MLSQKVLAACSGYNRILGCWTLQLRNASSVAASVSVFGLGHGHRQIFMGSSLQLPWMGLDYSNVNLRGISTTAQNYRARKSTRERKEKLKKKNKKEPQVKKTFIQKLMDQKARIAHILQRPPDNSHLPEVIDDVYFYQRFQDKIWTFAEAVQNHREFLHPTMRNFPKSQVICRIDIDLVYPNRPNKMMDTWKALVEMKSSFLTPGMVQPKILAFCLNDPEAIASVMEAGAETVGSHDLIKSIQEGHVSVADFDHVIAHPLMVIELTVIRGLLKRKFPSTNRGTVDVDLAPVVRKLQSGIKVEVHRTDREPDFAWIECPIGRLDMSTEDLEANFIAIMKDTLPRRVPGKLPGDFIVQCSLQAAHSSEKFILDKEYYFAICEDFAKPDTDSQMGTEVKSRLTAEPGRVQQSIASAS